MCVCVCVCVRACVCVCILVGDIFICVKDDISCRSYVVRVCVCVCVCAIFVYDMNYISFMSHVAPMGCLRLVGSL